MGAQPGENRFKNFQNFRAERVINAITEIVDMLQRTRTSFPNIHSASLGVSEHLQKLEDRSVHRSASTILKNSTFRICVFPLVTKSAIKDTNDFTNIIADIKIKRLENEIKRLKKALAHNTPDLTDKQPPSDASTANANANKLCILVTEILKHADFLFDVDDKKHLITKAGKYSSDRFITSSNNTAPYFEWLAKRKNLLNKIGADIKLLP